MFTFTQTDISGLTVIEPQVFWDERGFFMETYNQKEFQKAGITTTFVQDNHSKSAAWVLRGLHFQTNSPQSKLVRVVSGSVYDVAVDIRSNSSTYGKWFGILLSAENKKQLFVPQWFAHGFLTLKDNTEFVYKCDDFYDPVGEWWIIWNDPILQIDREKYYALSSLIISEKDQKNQIFESLSL